MFDANTFADGWKRLALPCMIAGLGFTSATPAQATAFTTPLPIAAVGMLDSSCLNAGGMVPTSSATASIQVSNQPVYSPGLSKASAILGGEMSALERIRMEQQGLSAPPPAIAAASASLLQNATCGLASFTPRVTPKPAVSQRTNSNEFLATSRVRIRHTNFTDRWERVSAAHLAPTQVQGIVGSGSLSDLATLEKVNRWVNRNIAHVSDRRFYGTGDYWALASETLRVGVGDCEDFAILKYQMLLAMGYPAEDMYLTLARDLARNADHAMLVVKQNGRFYLLDNSTERVLPADQSYDYRPTMSFNSESGWLHGYTRSEPQANQFAYRSVSATFIPRVMGLSR
jgi:predicted transglutaminase-like cysteine proteinase